MVHFITAPSLDQKDPKTDNRFIRFKDYRLKPYWKIFNIGTEYNAPIISKIWGRNFKITYESENSGRNPIRTFQGIN